MKKSTLLLLSATLSCSLAFAQGAEGDETNRLLFIPRFEVNPVAATGGSNYSGSKFGFGNSSLYTLFEGDFGGSNFSYSIEGHWLAGSTDEIKALYQNTFRPSETSFIDWAYLTYSPGNFDISLGKQILAIGTYELDAYDFDSYFDMSSTMWNNLSIYQYGASLGYNFDDANNLTFQFSSSPFSLRPFVKDGNNVPLFAYSLKYTGEVGAWSPIWSYNILEDYDYDLVGSNGLKRGTATHVMALGNKFSFGNFDWVVDYTNRWKWGQKAFSSEATVATSLKYNLNDKFFFTLKGGYEFNRCGVDVLGWEEDEPAEFFVPTSLATLGDYDLKGFGFGGALVEWYPLDELRVHAHVATNNFAKAVSFNLGATYYFDLLKYIRK